MKIAPLPETDEQERLLADPARLIRMCAMRFRNRGLDLDDLCQHGAIGLMRAERDFEPGGDVLFFVRAVRCIRLAMQGATMKASSPIYVSGHARAWEVRFRSKQAEMTAARGGEAPEDGEVIAAMGRMSPAVRETVEAAVRARRVQVQFVDPDHLKIHPIADGEDEPAPPPSSAAVARLREIVAGLPRLQREALTLHHGLGGDPPMPMTAVAKHLKKNWRDVDFAAWQATQRIKQLMAGDMDDRPRRETA